jgi:hypothetical protein
MQKSNKRIKWSLVDLTRPASELAAELGTTTQAVYAARRRLGIITPNLSGGKPGNKGGARLGNTNRKGTGSNLANLNIRIPAALLDAMRRDADRRKLTTSEWARLAFLAKLHEGTHNERTEEAQKTLDP